MRRGRINPISIKKRRQLEEEKALTAKLFTKQKGLCAKCGKPLGWASSKHEVIFRSRGGSPTEEENCELLCVSCHARSHGIKVVEGDEKLWE